MATVGIFYSWSTKTWVRGNFPRRILTVSQVAATGFDGASVTRTFTYDRFGRKKTGTLNRRASPANSTLRAGAKIVVWPKANIMVYRADEPALLVRLQTLAREQNIYPGRYCRTRCLHPAFIREPGDAVRSCRRYRRALHQDHRGARVRGQIRRARRWPFANGGNAAWPCHHSLLRPRLSVADSPGRAGACWPRRATGARSASCTMSRPCSAPSKTVWRWCAPHAGAGRPLWKPAGVTLRASITSR